MIYTKKTPWTLIMGVIMAAYAYMVSTGAMEPLIKFLGTSKLTSEMVTLGYAFGGIAIVIGLWQLLITPKQGQADYYLSTIAGLTFIMLIAFIVKWGLDPLMNVWSKVLQPSLGFNLHSVMNLNYVVLGILAGIIVVNVFKIPRWARTACVCRASASRPA